MPVERPIPPTYDKFYYLYDCRSLLCSFLRLMDSRRAPRVVGGPQLQPPFNWKLVDPLKIMIQRKASHTLDHGNLAIIKPNF